MATTYPLDFKGKTDVLVTLDKPTPTIWTLELKGSHDSRLTAEMLTKGIYPALDLVEKEYRKVSVAALKAADGKGGEGALIITGRTSQEKFFSNGFDFQQVLAAPGGGFVHNIFEPVLLKLLTFPIPTIAALTGHTYAAGVALALACDYRVMTSGKAWFCMNEVFFGASFPPSFVALIQEKARSPKAIKGLSIEGHKYTPQELLDAQIVDVVADGGTAGVLAASRKLAESLQGNAKTGVWGLMRSAMYRKTIEEMKLDLRVVMPPEELFVYRTKL